MRTFAYIIVALVAMLGLPRPLKAQCPMENKAFKAGEKLSYDLYFNWNFIWLRCGSAYYTIKADKYKGKDVLRNDLFCPQFKCFDQALS